MSAQIFESMPAKEYHARTELSRSQFADYQSDGPEYFYARHISKVIQREVTPAMVRGTILHAAILEATPLADLLQVWSGEVKAGTKNTTAWKEATSEAEANGKLLVTGDELSAYIDTWAAVRSEPFAIDLLKRCQRREVSFTWSDPCGLDLRGRADAMGDRVMCDLKITDRPLTTSGVQQLLSRRGGNYAMQDAWYTRGVRAVTGADFEFWFIFANPSPPYTVAVARVDDEWKQQAEVELVLDLEAFADRKRRNDWNRIGYGQGAIVERPKYDTFFETE